MKNIYRSFFAAIFLASTFAISQTTFLYTGALQTYTVPAGVSLIQIECYGAQGGGANGGLGGYAVATVPVTPSAVLEVHVGGNPTVHLGPGGYNGGGAVLMMPCGGGGDGWPGGGASDVRTSSSIADRMVVAGGGGGEGWSSGLGGAGGGTTGGNGAASWIAGTNGLGGGAAAGGAGGVYGSGPDSPAPSGTFGVGGNNSPLSTYCSGGAGGGGWYGGGGGYVSAGGGGSSYVSYPGSTGASTTAGVNPGHGYIIITEICDALISSVSDDEVCEGETVTLSASSPGTGTISWDGGVTDGAAFEPPVGTTTYTATSTDPDDCPFSVDILVNPAPTVDAGLDTNLCEGELLTLSGSGTADAYAWDGGVVDGVPFLPPGGTTMYHVTGDIVLTGCTAMDSVEVTMNNIDETVTVAGIDLTSNQSGASYQWVECPAYTDVAGATSQSFTPTQDGDYAVIITLNGCEDTSACETISGVGLTDIGLRDIVYPNPTSGEITIQFHGYFTYNIVNALGEKVISDAGKDVENLDISHLENGIYFIEIFAGENKSSFKVVKK